VTENLIATDINPQIQRAPVVPKARLKLTTRALRAYGLIAALIIVWVIFAALTDGIFLSPRNFSNLIRQTAVTGILSVGMVVVIVAGQIDLSVGSIVGLSGMVAVLAQDSLHWGLLGSLLLGLFIGLIVGAVQGALTAYARIPAFIVTIGGLLAWRGVTKGISGGNTYPIAVHSFKTLGQAYLSPTTGIVLMIVGVLLTIWLVLRQHRSRGLHGLTQWTPLGFLLRIAGPSILIIVFVLALNEYAGVPVPVIILLGVALAGAFVMRNTVPGRYLHAIGGNPEAARLSGINSRVYILGAFAALGILAALAGMIYTARVGSASPDAGTLLELDAIAACVIGGASLMGGRGTVLGALLGALFMASLDNGMSLRNVSDYIQDIVKGAILVAAVGLDTMGRRKN
jgi:D-xylose transport system permease protein